MLYKKYLTDKHIRIFGTVEYFLTNTVIQLNFC